MLKTPRRAVLQVHLRRHQAQKQQQQKKASLRTEQEPGKKKYSILCQTIKEGQLTCYSKDKYLVSYQNTTFNSVTLQSITTD